MSEDATFQSVLGAGFFDLAPGFICLGSDSTVPEVRFELKAKNATTQMAIRTIATSRPIFSEFDIGN